MKKSGFSKLKNTKENPLCLDDDGNVIEEPKAHGVGKKRIPSTQSNAGVKEGSGDIDVRSRETRSANKRATDLNKENKGNVNKKPKTSRKVLVDDDSDSDYFMEYAEYADGKDKIKVKKDERKEIEGMKKSGLRTRTSPKCLHSAVSKLKDPQKEAVKHMGLDCLLGMTINGVTAKIGYLMVDKLNTETMEVKEEDIHIKITPETVNSVLGLRNGGIDIEDQQTRVTNGNLIHLWKSTFGNKYVTQNRLMEEIIGTDDSGVRFKVFFLVLFVNVMCECSRDGTCNVKFLEKIRDVDMIADIDWCRYICNCVARSKKQWKRDRCNNFYCGPITYLTLLYVDSTSCPNMTTSKTRPSIKGWTIERLRERENAEKLIGGVGKAKMILSVKVNNGSYESMHKGATETSIVKYEGVELTEKSLVPSEQDMSSLPPPEDVDIRTVYPVLQYVRVQLPPPELGRPSTPIPIRHCGESSVDAPRPGAVIPSHNGSAVSGSGVGPDGNSAEELPREESSLSGEQVEPQAMALGGAKRSLEEALLSPQEMRERVLKRKKGEPSTSTQPVSPQPPATPLGVGSAAVGRSSEETPVTRLATSSHEDTLLFLMQLLETKSDVEVTEMTLKGVQALGRRLKQQDVWRARLAEAEAAEVRMSTQIQSLTDAVAAAEARAAAAEARTEEAEARAAAEIQSLKEAAAAAAMEAQKSCEAFLMTVNAPNFKK